MMRETLLSKLQQVYPYYLQTRREELADALLRVDKTLQPHIEQWLCNQPFSDVAVREKYTLNMLLHMRIDNDFVDAILALDAYCKDESKEYLLWQGRC